MLVVSVYRATELQSYRATELQSYRAAPSHGVVRKKAGRDRAVASEFPWLRHSYRPQHRPSYKKLESQDLVLRFYILSGWVVLLQQIRAGLSSLAYLSLYCVFPYTAIVNTTKVATAAGYENRSDLLYVHNMDCWWMRRGWGYASHNII